MTDGIYDNISITDYHANTTHMSATQIKEAHKSIKQWHWYRTGKIEKPKGTHLDFGNAFELALLDKTGFSESVAIFPDHEILTDTLKQGDFKTPRNTNYYKDQVKVWQELNKGKYYIADKGEESWETIQHMLASAYADKIIQGLIANTEYQLSLFWTDEQTGLKLKTRPDICKRKKNVVVNVKTTVDGSPSAFSRELAKFDYPLQATVEIEGCLQSGLMPSVDNYFWLVFEKVPPYNATIYEFDEQDRRVLSDKLEFLLNQIKKSTERDFYPGYSNLADNEYGILKAEIPLWYKM